MTHTYQITGMTCGGCVAKAKSEVLKVAGITGAELQLSAPQATITMQQHISTSLLQSALHKAGNYIITEASAMKQELQVEEESRSWFETYKPILIIFAYITGISLSIEFVKGSFILESWMQNFMAGFFLVFSFFKMLNIKAFAESYSSYDLIAKRWLGWGYVYAFMELLLGLAYLCRYNPLVTNIVAFIIMSVSIAGVLQSVFNKRKIQCACLGAVFNLPMSTLTIVEDAVMIVMSAIMIISLV